MAELSTRPAVVDVGALRDAVRGTVLAPGDDGYDAARIVGLGGVDDHPAVIVKVADSDDVRTVNALARATGLDLAVRSGGHSGSGHSTVEGGIVLDVRELRGLEIDVANRTAWVGSGLTAGDVTVALAAHGLALGFGDTASVGVAGITLGGGVGYLVRRHGLTIDSLLAVELVTADGQVIVADQASHPDLFWAVRGGGGNFGVVTRFRFRLQPLEQIVGGMLILPATAGSLAGFMHAAADAPEPLSTILNVMPCPPMPMVPDDVVGRVVLLAMLCWSGPVEEGEAVMAPFRALGEPIADMVAPMPYPGMYPPEDPDYRPMAVMRQVFMDEVSSEDAVAILEGLAASDAAMRVVQLRALGGAMARIPADATAYAHRDRAVMAAVAAFHEGGDDHARKLAWVEALAMRLADGPGVYVNFIEGESGRIREAYPAATWDRLVAVKRRYDPDNLFRRNHNVAPASR